MDSPTSTEKGDKEAIPGKNADPSGLYLRTSGSTLMVEDGLYTFRPTSSTQLQQVLTSADAAAQFPAEVVNIAPRRLPTDLAQLTSTARKALFIRSLMPAILVENRRIREQRSKLMKLQQEFQGNHYLETSAAATLTTLARQYDAGTHYELTNAEHVRELLAVLQRRIDTVPPSLVLAQAAIESGWGTSRFVREGNNLFGQWVFGSKEGIVPTERPSDATYKVASFSTLTQSIRGYLNNLNMGWAYASFRQTRQQQRLANGPLDPLALAAELTRYSTRGQAYTEELKSIIKGNRLQQYDSSLLCVLPRGEASLLALQVVPGGNERAN
jgi:Bax protein